LISTLLGPVHKPIFDILYRSALRAGIQLEPDLELRSFTTRFVRLARADKLKIEVLDGKRNLYLVEKMAWLVVIASEQDLQQARAEYLERLLYANEIVGTFVLACDFPPRWGWAQVSQGKRMKAQAAMKELLPENQAAG
jgi:hypothetical protein